MAAPWTASRAAPTLCQQGWAGPAWEACISALRSDRRADQAIGIIDRRANQIDREKGTSQSTGVEPLQRRHDVSGASTHSSTSAVAMLSALKHAVEPFRVYSLGFSNNSKESSAPTRCGRGKVEAKPYALRMSSVQGALYCMFRRKMILGASLATKRRRHFGAHSSCGIQFLSLEYRAVRCEVPADLSI